MDHFVSSYFLQIKCGFESWDVPCVSVPQLSSLFSEILSSLKVSYSYSSTCFYCFGLSSVCFFFFSLTCLLFLSPNMFQGALLHLSPLLVNTSGNGILKSYYEGNPSPHVFHPSLSYFFVDSFPSGVNLTGFYIFQNVQCIPLNFQTAYFVWDILLKSFNILSWYMTKSSSPTDIFQKSKRKEKNIL